MSDHPLQAKKAALSAIENHVHKVFGADLNSRNTVFGGLIMSILDRLASIVAERHASNICVTASVDALHFIAPARQGDILFFKAAVNRAWNTSMEIGTKVIAEDPVTGKSTHIVSAYFTFVAVGSDGKPCPVPAVIAETPCELRRYEEAEMRREQRIAMRHLRTEIRSRYEK